MSEGAKKAEITRNTGIFESFTKMNESLFSMDIRKAAAAYIDFVEELTRQSLELYDSLTSWAKDTPFAPMFELQTSVSRKLAETTISAARNLWQVQAVSEEH
jgi:hypothetical protein